MAWTTLMTHASALGGLTNPECLRGNQALIVLERHTPRRLFGLRLGMP